MQPGQETSMPSSKGRKQTPGSYAMIRFAYRFQKTQKHTKKSRGDSSEDTVVTCPGSQWLHYPSTLPSSAFTLKPQDCLMFQYGCHNACHGTHTHFRQQERKRETSPSFTSPCKIFQKPTSIGLARTRACDHT